MLDSSLHVRAPGPRRSPSTTVLVGAALWLLFVHQGANGQSQVSGDPVKLDAAIYRELRSRGSTCACVELQAVPSGGQPLAERSATFRRAQRAFLETLPSDEVHIRHRYRYSPVVVLEVRSESILTRLENSPLVRRVRCDRRGEGGLVESRAVIGADKVQELGILGAGRVTAVLDTGVDSDHPDLEDAIIRQYHFLEAGEDVGEGAEDDHGHGTHVTGIIASRGLVAPLGIAPGSQIVSVKVLDRDNTGWFSDWAAGVEYVTQLHLEDNGIQVDALNLSLISFDLFSGVCDDEFPALHFAVEAAREAGIIAFACSGNTGLVNSMNLPGCYSSTVSVGSVPDDSPGELSSFTNRGPLLGLLAPGERITSCSLGGGSRGMRGCSMAVPHVAATAMLMREVDPGLAPDTIYELMRATGVPVLDPRSGRTYPRLDAHASVLAARKRAGGVAFHRGDANTDGRLDILDPIFSLNYLFLGSDPPECLEAADANDDDQLDITDGIFLLEFLTLGVSAPPLPGPPGLDCGLDLAGKLGCVRYPLCDL